MLTAAAIAHALPRINSQNIERSWPLVQAALARRAIATLPCEVAAAATIAVETGNFLPIKERGGPGYFTKLYWEDERRRTALGNLQESDAAQFCGRGFVQITGRANYAHYGECIGIDLVAAPQRALEPEVAAELLAWFFFQRRIEEQAEQANWELVRRRVNGGLNGWADFISYVHALEAAGATSSPASAPATQEQAQ